MRLYQFVVCVCLSCCQMHKTRHKGHENERRSKDMGFLDSALVIVILVVQF